uniref:Uncharacterized protein n=1 Tax=Amphimedon queenslandica TaxID=400682 RepID=A0A1X7SVB0_AMPQE
SLLFSICTLITDICSCSSAISLLISINDSF